MFWFPSAHKSYVYATLQPNKCAIAWCLKLKVHSLMKNILLLKNAIHHLMMQGRHKFSASKKHSVCEVL